MSKIVLEDFNEGNGYYKINLAYLSKEQVEEIEALVSNWNPSDEVIKSCIGMCLTDVNEQRLKDYGTNLKECLAWLEAQGENSVCKVKIGETYKCIASPRYTCFRNGDIYHVKDNFVAELINTCSGCFVLLEKKGEKPDDKVEPKFRIGDVIEVKPMKCHGKIFTGKPNKIVDITEKSYILDDDKAYSIELQDGWKLSEKKPTKWSKEDEDMLDDLICYFDKSLGLRHLLFEVATWLKSLKDRVQLQNTWKPSDEQITWLYRAADDASKDSRMKQILNELLSDLKKLKEE